MLLNREAILAAQDLKTVDKDVPEWGGVVRLRTMTSAARESLGESMAGADGKVDTTAYREKMLAACIVGDDGELLFTHEDVAALSGKKADVIQRLFAEAEKLNGMSPGATEEAAGN